MTFLDEGTTKVTATTIKWKEGMVGSCYSYNYQHVFFCSNLILVRYFTFIEGPSKWSCHEKNGKKRPHEEDSFFTWFSGAPKKDDIDDIHDSIAELIKEDLWANPLTYFNNDADEEDFGDEDDEEVNDNRNAEFATNVSDGIGICRNWNLPPPFRTLVHDTLLLLMYFRFPYLGELNSTPKLQFLSLNPTMGMLGNWIPIPRVSQGFLSTKKHLRSFM
ncbi:hypothetical protein OSB04_004067 [Centaurea solstitialis]|uniref:Uncharacterized protein n=1 Tax=Centaurea solstitialis TaxID=347529 RepID=A0AA38WVV3_9ASTR|nr:hypothetical protein OSB04_004067 [Centaurea solstitialis]